MRCVGYEHTRGTLREHETHISSLYHSLELKGQRNLDQNGSAVKLRMEEA